MTRGKPSSLPSVTWQCPPHLSALLTRGRYVDALRELLSSHPSRVVEHFASLDTTGSRAVTLEGFAAALEALEIVAPRAAFDQLYACLFILPLALSTLPLALSTLPLALSTLPLALSKLGPHQPALGATWQIYIMGTTDHSRPPRPALAALAVLAVLAATVTTAPNTTACQPTARQPLPLASIASSASGSGASGGRVRWSAARADCPCDKAQAWRCPEERRYLPPYFPCSHLASPSVTRGRCSEERRCAEVSS